MGYDAMSIVISYGLLQELAAFIFRTFQEE